MDLPQQRQQTAAAGAAVLEAFEPLIAPFKADQGVEDDDLNW
jgi:hypothetical protein